MPSSLERSRNNVRAGIFVTVTLILALAVIMTLTDAWNALTRRVNSYVVTFPLATGVADLRAGSKVLIGGVDLGAVEEVAPAFDDNGGLEIVKVSFEVDHRVRLFSDAKIAVISPLIGADASLSITSVGTESAGAPSDGVIVGQAGATLLTSLLGADAAQRADQIIEDTAATVANTRELSELFASIPDDYAERIVPFIDDIGATSADIQEIVSGLRNEQWPQWASRVDEVLNWSVQATAELDAMLDEGHGLVSDARETLTANREGVDTTVSNIEEASERVRALTERVETETIDKVHAVLDSGQTGLDEAAAALERIRQDYDAWAVGIGESLGNASLASQQLKLATIEVRRSPWKLLYRPSADELEHELLYEAARSFAVAAADLKAASTSVQRVLDNHGDRLADDENALQRVQSTLQESLDRYLTAQHRLFDVLLMDEP